MTSWLPFRYRDFHDFPRAIVVEYKGALYFFDCLFDPKLDDYPDEYCVYRITDESIRNRIDSISWTDLGNRSLRIGAVPTNAVEFDITRRRTLNARVFELLGLK